MTHRNRMTRHTAAALLVTVLTVACASAQSEPREPAIARSAADPDLQWMPCPPVFPAGCEVAVLWGNPGAGRSDIFLRAPGNYRFPAHYHTSPEHMILVSGQLRVNYAGQDPVILEPGNYAYGPSMLGHDAHCTSRSSCVLFVSFESPVDAEPFAGSLD